MSIVTRSQHMAQKAFALVETRNVPDANKRKEYRSFAREFPTLVHQCGLAQAVAFAQAKKGMQAEYVGDLAKVLSTSHPKVVTLEQLAQESRTLPLGDYLRLSRDAIEAAVWIKRYVEALFPSDKEAS